MASILIVDDEKKITTLLEGELSDEGHEVTTATDGDDAIRILRAKRFDVVLTDLRLGRTDGVQVLRAAKEIDPECAVLLMTAYATVKTAVSAMKDGAADYLEKPVDLEKLRLVLERSLEARRLAEENRRLKDGMRAGRIGGANMVRGKSRAMAQVMALAERVAPSEATVLLTGESGTGKEVMARAIHEWSARRRHPLVAVNCAALAETLLESELFGHEKGAFTDAHERKMGWFEVARKGTVFLDEIAEMKPSTQAKLLRVLEDRRFHRLGGSEIIEADVRIIAATNRDLPEEIDEGRFREDLFYRLNVFPIELPPLRERLDDLDDLCAHFLKRTGAGATRIEPEAMDALRQYDWPGNLRELRNVIERAVILAGDEPIGLEEIHIPARRFRDIPSAAMGAVGAGGDLTLSDQEEQMIRQALEKSGGNKSKAARLLGITRRALYGRLEKYGI
ncbi:MAG TPA: sigma-54 dependent transcriptional regulator [bacterium]|nr:sigma-54 dependent transcriptional regulator [bacterium]